MIPTPNPGSNTQRPAEKSIGDIIRDANNLSPEQVEESVKAAQLHLGADELALLEPWRQQVPASVFGQFGPDTSSVYLGHNIGRDRLVFGRVDIADGKASAPVTLAERDDAELDDFLLSKDHSFALLVWNVAGRNEIERISLPDGKRSALPATPDQTPDGILRQMGAYVAALTQIYPGRVIEPYVLWTRTANLMALDPDLVSAALKRAALP